MEELSSLACRVLCFLAQSLFPLSFATFDHSSSESKTTHCPSPLKRPPHPSLGCTSSSTQIDGPGNESLHGQREKTPFQSPTRSLTCSASVPGGCETSIDILPEDVLLQIFDFYQMCIWSLSEWYPLILVCRRWHQLIISSPHRLDLYLLCTRGKSFRKNLDLLPTFPIVVDSSYLHYDAKKWSPDEEEDILAALEHPDRISRLNLRVTRLLLAKVAHWPEQLPILTELSLSLGEGENVSALRNEFLGRCAPRLRTLYLGGIPFPTLPTLLSSATDLISLDLQRIPHTGYISPEAMVAGLAALTRLEGLRIEFQSSTRPDHSDTSRWAALPTHVIFPALTSFTFQGAGEYLEDLVALVEAPRLYFITIRYLEQYIFYVPQLFRFVGQFRVLKQDRKTVYVFLKSGELDIHFQLDVENDQVDVRLNLQYLGLGQSSHWQHSDLARTLRWCSEVFSGVRNLSINVSDLYPCQQGDGLAKYLWWLEVLIRFTAVETLLVPAPLSRYIAGALKYVTDEMISDIWPALRLLCLEGQPLQCVEEFISARQFSAHPVTAVNERNMFHHLRLRTP